MPVGRRRVSFRLLTYLCASTIAVLLPALFVVYHGFEIPDPIVLLLSGTALLGALVAGLGIQIRELRQLHRSHVQAESKWGARESHLLGLTTLSARIAHDLSTPLSTMSVLIGELRHSAEPPPDWKESIDVLWGQIQICKRSLTTMAQAANLEQIGNVQQVSARQFIHDVAGRFQLQRPAVPLKLARVYLDDALMLESDHTLPQALLNLLDSAAHASRGAVELRCGQKENLRLWVHIVDRGPRIPSRVRERIGKDPITTKDPGCGSGAGAPSAHTVIERFGGAVHFQDRWFGGIRVVVELPLFRMSEEDESEQHRLQVAG